MIKLSDYKCRKPLYSDDVLSGQQIEVVDNGDETVTINTSPLLATKAEFDAHADDDTIHGMYYEQKDEPVAAVDGSWWYGLEIGYAVELSGIVAFEAELTTTVDFEVNI